jgi:hypothetical protein
VIGGWSSGSVTNSVELFDCRANVWLDFKDNDESMFEKHILFNIKIHKIQEKN